MVLIRAATREDCSAIMELKKELADHQNMGHLPMLSVQELERDGFDMTPPCFQCLVAETTTETGESKKVVGYALYFTAYSSWQGKTILLEDLCVSKGVRGGGIGSKLVKELAKIALKQNCARIQFEVLDWNPSRKFYNSLDGVNTTETEGRHNFRLSRDAICKLVQN